MDKGLLFIIAQISSVVKLWLIGDIREEDFFLRKSEKDHLSYRKKKE